MQIVGSQIGISRAIDRRSHWAVSVGNVPSTGSAETGRKSPSPASIIAVTFCTNAGAPAGTTSGRYRSDVASEGTFTSCSESSAASTAASFLATIVSPRLP